jgi:hypothetical protein
VIETTMGLFLCAVQESHRLVRGVPHVDSAGCGRPSAFAVNRKGPQAATEEYSRKELRYIEDENRQYLRRSIYRRNLGRA